MAKDKGGRPSKFNESLAAQIMDLAMGGSTDEEIAAKIGISIRAFTNWKKRYDGLGEGLKDAKCVADELVEASLFSRATGYSHRAVKFFWDAKKGDIKSQPYIEHHPPDTTACIFWLKNRQPANWRDVNKDPPTESEVEFDNKPMSPWSFRKAD